MADPCHVFRGLSCKADSMDGGMYYVGRKSLILPSMTLCIASPVACMSGSTSRALPPVGYRFNGTCIWASQSVSGSSFESTVEIT